MHVPKASEKYPLTENKVDVMHLQEQIDLRQAKIDVTEDLKRQIAELRE